MEDCGGKTQRIPILVGEGTELVGLYGTFQHTIDSRGRLFIPARMREKLGDSVIITKLFEDCLTIYTIDRWRKAEEKLETMTQTAQIDLRPLFANASEVDLDSQGRILLAKDLRDKVGIDKNVTIVGIGLHVQIWDSEAYKKVAETENNNNNLKNVVDKHGF